jgi:hypothetical protein
MASGILVPNLSMTSKTGFRGNIPARKTGAPEVNKSPNPVGHRHISSVYNNGISSGRSVVFQRNNRAPGSA